MIYNIVQIFEGQVLDDQQNLTLWDICSHCGLSPTTVLELVNEGIIDPSGERIHAWRFSHSSVDRIRRAQRLQNDLKVNLAGAALALQLLDRIEELQSEL
jgi:chaperone modulatory protein CbpM